MGGVRITQQDKVSNPDQEIKRLKLELSRAHRNLQEHKARAHEGFQKYQKHSSKQQRMWRYKAEALYDVLRAVNELEKKRALPGLEPSTISKIITEALYNFENERLEDLEAAGKLVSANERKKSESN